MADPKKSQPKAEAETKVSKKALIQLPPLEDFLKAGVHFGHKTSRWNPKMKKFIYDERSGVHIIDVVKSMKMLDSALQFLQEAAERGNILFVGTKGQAATLIQNAALDNGAFYVNRRWPGGLFTNFEMIKKSVDKLIKMEENHAAGAEDLVKKEQLLLGREIERLNKLYEGIKFMEKLPTAVVIVDTKLEKNALKESANAGIPVIALIDTNCDPDLVDYPIPANDDSIKSISLFMELFGKAVSGNKRSEALVALRRDHNARLSQLRSEYEAESERKRAMEEAERVRLKKMRSGDKVEDVVVRVGKEEVKSEKSEKKSSKTHKIEGSDLSARVQKALVEAGYKTLEELKKLAKSELTKIKGIGEKAAEEIQDFVSKI